MSIADELSKLEALRQSGALSEAEFARAKETVLSGAAAPAGPDLGQHLADQLAEVKQQNELAQIDREWEIERQQYLIAGGYGGKHVPTTGMAVAAGGIGGLVGALWTVMAFATTRGAPDDSIFAVVKVVFPLFGVVFTIVAVGYGIYCWSRAQKYQQAYHAYQRRRQAAR